MEKRGSKPTHLAAAANTGPFRSTCWSSICLRAKPGVDISGFADTGQPTGTPLQGLTIAANGYISFDNILGALSVTDSDGPVEIHYAMDLCWQLSLKSPGAAAGNQRALFAAQTEDSGSRSEVIPFVIDTQAFRANLGFQ